MMKIKVAKMSMTARHHMNLLSSSSSSTLATLTSGTKDDNKDFDDTSSLLKLGDRGGRAHASAP
jgi:hypothetical protein